LRGSYNIQVQQFLTLQYRISSVSNWNHKGPREYYSKCVEMFGQPTAISNYWGEYPRTIKHIGTDLSMHIKIPIIYTN
jgi:hypothetical protein